MPDAQLAADGMDAVVWTTKANLDELADVVAKMSVLLDRVIELQESLVGRIEVLERDGSER